MFHCNPAIDIHIWMARNDYKINDRSNLNLPSKSIVHFSRHSSIKPTSHWIYNPSPTSRRKYDPYPNIPKSLYKQAVKKSKLKH